MNINIPMIRKVLPTLIAKDIIGVQPMASPHKKKYWPHQHTVRYNQIKEVERWCYANFKSANWRNVDGFFAFKRADDFALFRLRWL